MLWGGKVGLIVLKKELRYNFWGRVGNKKGIYLMNIILIVLYCNIFKMKI